MASKDNGSSGAQSLYDDTRLRWVWIDDSISELVSEVTTTMKAVENTGNPCIRQVFRNCIVEWEHRLLLLVEHMNNFPKIN